MTADYLTRNILRTSDHYQVRTPDGITERVPLARPDMAWDFAAGIIKSDRRTTSPARAAGGRDYVTKDFLLDVLELTCRKAVPAIAQKASRRANLQRTLSRADRVLAR